MTIHQMTASFGTLAGETLELHEGLNVLQGRNGSGKSTWCAFLRAMFFGIPTGQRDKAGFLAEKNRYQPWSGAPLEGTVSLTWQGQEITLRRFSKGTVPFGGFEAVYTATGGPVPGLTGENCGEKILGVGREVFERTAFVGQGALAIGGTPELETRIAALASSGEEDVSFSETQRRLKDWRNAIMSNKSVGAIPKKQQELAAIGEVLARLESAQSRADEAKSRLETLAREQASLENEGAYHRAVAEQGRLERYESAKNALEIARREEQNLKQELARYGTLPTAEELRAAQGELAFAASLETALKNAVIESGAAETAAREARNAATEPLFGDLTPDELKRKIEAEKAAPPSKKPSGLRILALVLCALALAGLAFWAVLRFAMDVALSPAVPMICGVVAVLSALLAILVKGKLQPPAMLQQYGVADFGELDARAEQFAKNWAVALEGERQAEFLSGRVAEYTRQREEVLQKLRNFVKPFAPDATDGVSLSVALSRALMLEDKLTKAKTRTEAENAVWQAVSAEGEPTLPPVLGAVPIRTAEETASALAAVAEETRRLSATLAMARGEQNTLGDSAVLLGQAAALQEELGALQRDYDAITVALEALDVANEQLQARFSPELNRRAGLLFSELTGERYSDVTLDRNFEVQVAETGALIPRRILTLSQGTADQLYLAVRLAICDLVLPEDAPVPLVLDDSLVNFDDLRAKRAVELLQRLAKTRQIALFTCTEREREILSCITAEKTV